MKIKARIRINVEFEGVHRDNLSIDRDLVAIDLTERIQNTNPLLEVWTFQAVSHEDGVVFLWERQMEGSLYPMADTVEAEMEKANKHVATLIDGIYNAFGIEFVDLRIFTSASLESVN